MSDAEEDYTEGSRSQRDGEEDYTEEGEEGSRSPSEDQADYTEEGEEEAVEEAGNESDGGGDDTGHGSDYGSAGNEDEINEVAEPPTASVNHNPFEEEEEDTKPSPPPPPTPHTPPPAPVAPHKTADGGVEMPKEDPAPPEKEEETLAPVAPRLSLEEVALDDSVKEAQETKEEVREVNGITTSTGTVKSAADKTTSATATKGEDDERPSFYSEDTPTVSKKKKTNVLVIGGGMGGVAACTGIRSYVASSVEITLVEPKDHMEVSWAAYRALFVKEVAESSIFALDKFATYQNVVHIMSTVTELMVDANQAKLANGTVLEFDVCVLALGAANPYAGWGRGPTVTSTTRAERLQALQKEGDSLLEAKSVLIVGGGLVGTELAGDLAIYSRDRGKSARVTIVHSGPHLCHKEFNETAAKMLLDKLVELGVKAVFNDKAIPNSEGKMVLESTGEILVADQVVMANGLDSVYNKFLDKKFLNDKGWIETDEKFQVKGAEGKLFAIGDCCTVLENTGNSIMNNVGVIGYNVNSVLEAKKNGKQDPYLYEHSSHCGVYICTVGPEDGVAHTYVGSIDLVIPTWKNYSFFLYDVRSKFGLEEEEKK